MTEQPEEGQPETAAEAQAEIHRLRQIIEAYERLNTYSRAEMQNADQTDGDPAAA